MAAVLTVTRTPYQGQNEGKKYEKIKIEWTSHTDGSGSVQIPNMSGYLIKVITDPGATAPTDNYDITLVDADGYDAAESLLINRDTANTEVVYPVVSGAATPVLLLGTHTFTIANAGSTKDGVCILYLVESL